jgi:hypothetical protein
MFLTKSPNYNHMVFDLNLRGRKIDYPYIFHKKGLEILLKLSESAGTQSESIISIIFSSLLPIDYLIDLLCKDDLYS